MSKKTDNTESKIDDVIEKLFVTYDLIEFFIKCSTITHDANQMYRFDRNI